MKKIHLLEHKSFRIESARATVRQRSRSLLLAVSGFLLLSTIATGGLGAATVHIETPRGGFTTTRLQLITGQVTDYNENRATLIINGIPQTMLLEQGRFRVQAVVSPGNNLVEVQAGGASDRVSFFATVPARDIKVVLTWDTPTDVDLWVIDPKGEKCYYQNKSTASGGNLDVDVTTGYGPETFTMAKALPGTYSVEVQYYNSNDAPVTRVKVYVILKEGTPKEERQEFQFVMTKQQQVYHIGDFTVEGSDE